MRSGSPRVHRWLRWLRWLRRVAVVVLAVMLLTWGLVALYLSRPISGPGHELLDALEGPIRPSEVLMYNVHRALGDVFSLCPCTAALSEDQYRRAGFHRPADETPAP